MWIVSAYTVVRLLRAAWLRAVKCQPWNILKSSEINENYHFALSVQVRLRHATIAHLAFCSMNLTPIIFRKSLRASHVTKASH